MNYYQNGSTKSDDWAMWNVYGKGGALETTYNNYFTKNNYIKDAWGRADTPAMAANWPTLINYENETFQKIITGEQPIDYFDTFVKEWKRLGGDAVTNEVNAK
jgi:putative aldouronate transport system substrate-binding protein